MTTQPRKAYIEQCEQEIALTEKENEIQQIREHEFQRGYQEAEGKYRQLMDGAVGLATLVCECWESNQNMIAVQEYHDAKLFLKQTEDQRVNCCGKHLSRTKL